MFIDIIVSKELKVISFRLLDDMELLYNYSPTIYFSLNFLQFKYWLYLEVGVFIQS